MTPMPKIKTQLEQALVRELELKTEVDKLQKRYDEDMQALTIVAQQLGMTITKRPDFNDGFALTNFRAVKAEEALVNERAEYTKATTEAAKHFTKVGELERELNEWKRGDVGKANLLLADRTIVAERETFDLREKLKNARALVLEETKRVFNHLRLKFPEAVGTDWQSINNELTMVASLPTVLIAVPVGVLNKQLELLRYIEQYGLEPDGSSHDVIEDMVKPAITALVEQMPEKVVVKS